MAFVNSQLHMRVELVGFLEQPPEELMCGLELLRSELDNSGRPEVLVEQLPGVLPPLVVGREAKRPAETHSIR